MNYRDSIIIVLSYFSLVFFLHAIFVLKMAFEVDIEIISVTLLFIFTCYFHGKDLRKGKLERFDIVHICCISFLLYFVLQSPVFPADNQIQKLAYFFFKFLFSFGFLWALISKNDMALYIRKSNVFSLLVLFLYFIDTKIIESVNLGITKTNTEWLSVWESLFVLAIISSLGFIKGSRKKSYLLVLFTVGHLANYWAAGYAKFLLDGGPISWVFENDTLSLLKSNYYANVYTPASTEILGLSFSGYIETLANFSVYIGQLISLIVPVFPILLAPLTIFYDFFHVMVGLYGGVWFYKWIFINIIILKEYKSIWKSFLRIRWFGRLMSIAVIFFSFWGATVVHLGWYDTRQGALIKNYAVIGGDRVLLDNKYFSSGSLFMQSNQFTLFQNKSPVHFFATLDYDILQKSRSCSNEIYRTTRHPKYEDTKMFVERFFDERNLVEEWLMTIQPYHVALPQKDSTMSVLDLDANKIDAFEFEMTEYCFDDEYKTIKEEVVETVVIRRNEKAM